MDTFGVLLKLEEHLVALAQDHPFFAGLIVFVIIGLAANIAITQIIELRKFLRSEWVRKPVVLVGFVVAFGAAIGLSIVVVHSLRKSTEPLPKIVEESSVAIGQPLRLQWTYDRPSRFEIQSAKNATFSQDLKKEGYRNGTLILLEHVNDDRYWRVRAVDANNESASGWSSPVRLAHYDSSLTRIKNTGSVSVAMSDSFNEAFFKYETKDGTLKGYDVAIIDEIVKNLHAQLGLVKPLDLKRVHVAWQKLLGEPASGRADIIISTITSLSERATNFSIKFSKPYYCTTQSIAYRPPASDQPVPQMIAKKRVGVQNGTTSHILLERFIAQDESIKQTHYDQTDKMFAALANNQVDYGFSDTPLARAAERRYPSGTFAIRELVREQDFPKDTRPEEREERYAVAVRAGETELIDAVDRIVDDLRQKKLGEWLEQAIQDFYAGNLQNAPAINAKKDPSVCRSG